MKAKNLFIGLAGLCVSSAILVYGSVKEPAKATYPKTTVCLAVNRQTDVVTVADCNGTEWTFTGCQDFEEGDLIALIMSNNGTPDNIWDDTVVTARYSGGTNLFDEVYSERRD